MIMIMGYFKNPRKSKWFLVCFRPEESLKPDAGSERNTLHQNILFALSNEKRDHCPESNGGGKSGRRRFPRFFKTIFSNATSSLAKKKRNERSEKDPLCSNISSKFEKIFNTSNEKKSKSLLKSVSTSSHSSLFSSPRGYSSMRSSSSSSSISSMISNSRSGSERKQGCIIDMKESKPNKKTVSIQKKEKDGNLSTEIGLYFMLICLVGLIFWGKAFAIFCTSTCLFLVPCIFKGLALDLVEEKSEEDSVDIDSDEYKKKVIMEGLLQRNHRRHV